jgi:protoporphyrinogen IX oxidase
MRNLRRFLRAPLLAIFAAQSRSAMYVYVKALHIIFIVTWFSGMFYIVRLFIYCAEAHEKPEPERSILLPQLSLMARRLWYGITWPSAVLTLIFGTWMFLLYGSLPLWLAIKLCFVLGLYAYHISLHVIFAQQQRGLFSFTSQQLRVWNEVATIFLVAIVMLVVVKDSMSLVWGLGGLIAFVALLMGAIAVYKRLRAK